MFTALPRALHLSSRQPAARRTASTATQPALETLEERRVYSADPARQLLAVPEGAAEAESQSSEQPVLMHAGACCCPGCMASSRDLPTAPGGGSLTTAPMGALNPLNSIPSLNSNAGAAVSIYLDFDGHTESVWGSYSNVVTPVYSIDGDLTTFSDTELAAITEVWRRVAEDYAPFNVNVTTVAPSSFADGVAMRISIGGNGSWYGSAGGVAYLNSFTTGGVYTNTAYVFSNMLYNDPKYVAEAASHEAGHAFGLQHQSTYSGTTKTAEYSSGSGNVAPIMGNSYYASRSRWANGQSSPGWNVIQDDMAVIARAANGFGYRGDDYGNTVATATAISPSGQSLTAAGIITTTSDVDALSFSTGAGNISLTVSNASVGANLDFVIELRNTSGVLLATSSSTNSSGASIGANLAQGTYVLIVKSDGAYGSVGQWTLSGTVFSTVPLPTQPGNFQATVANSRQVNLTWADSANETGYRVYQKVSGVWTEIATLAADTTSYSVIGLQPRTGYDFYVEGYNSGGRGTTSAIRVTTPIDPPTEPLGVSATVVSNTRIDLTWVSATGQTSYAIYHDDGSGGATWRQVGIASRSAIRFNVVGLSANTAYQFRITAVNAGGTTAALPVSATTLVNPPTAPTNLTATLLSGGQVQFSWNDAGGETSYRILYREGRTGVVIGTASANATSATISLAPGVRRQIYVEAVNAGGTAVSNLVTVLPIDVPPAPENVAAQVRSNSVTLRWDLSSFATGYNIYQWNGSSWTQIAQVSSRTRAHTIFNLTPATTYQFYVEATNSVGSSAAPSLFATTDTVRPSVPLSLTATTISGTQVNLAWNDSQYEEGYRIFARSRNGIQLVGTVTAGTTTFSVTGLNSSTTYSFYLEAYNSRGFARSSFAVATTQSAVPAPNLLAFGAQSYGNTIIPATRPKRV